MSLIGNLDYLVLLLLYVHARRPSSGLKYALVPDIKWPWCEKCFQFRSIQAQKHPLSLSLSHQSD